jgi:predicted MFS family arabinose efflux permease
MLTGSGSVTSGQVGWLWVAVGLGGSLGTLTGALVERAGRPAAWCACAGLLALANLGVAASVATGSAVLAGASMACFGAGYMSLTAVLILWARQVWPDGAGAGTSVVFIALATGQALGAAGFDAAAGPGTSAVLALLAAALCTAVGLAGLGRGR